MMKNRFLHAINDMRGLINDWSAPVLLAVSGGMDSMCMADLFVRCLPSGSLAIAHCNFNLRGEESDADQALVSRWAEERDVRLHVKSFGTEAYACEKGISIEMAARELRYAWFSELCSEFGYKAAAVAHNADDNAETLILNLLRGTGLAGLSGMSPVSRIPYSSSEDALLVRPLLTFTRKQIEGYVYANRIPYRVDSTNLQSDYKRNRIRNEVFPVFTKINPSIIRTLNREMVCFAEARGIVDDWCAGQIGDMVEYSGDVRINCRSLISHKHWRYLLYYILEPYGFNSAVLASLEDLLTSERTVSGKRFESEEYVLMTGREYMIVKLKSQLSERKGPPVPCPVPKGIMPVRAAGTYHFNGRVFKVETLPWHADMSLRQPEGVLVFDAGNLEFPFVLRDWRKGDWFVPFGMKGKKKVSDLFADLKYDALQKESSVMIVDVVTEGLAESQHIAAVAGVRIDDRYKVTSATSRIVRITAVTEC